MPNDTQTTSTAHISDDEKEALAYVKDIKGFYSDLMSFIVIVPALFILNYFTSPAYMWAWWVLFGWGISLAIHALSVFEFFHLFSPDWEKKQIEKRLGRKL
jgi:peptidoglycan biosynthesis protein MviN/MurJ (putative lipid II flippase)